MLFKRWANLYALIIGFVWFLPVESLYFLKIGTPEKVAMTFGILTTNILFSLQITDNLNRLDNIIFNKNKTLKERDNIDNSIATASDTKQLKELSEKLSTYEQLLESRDTVFGAHLSFTLGVVVSIFFILIGSIEHHVLGTAWGFSLARAGGFGCFAVGYGELIYSSYTIQKGIRADWKKANARRTQLVEMEKRFIRDP